MDIIIWAIILGAIFYINKNQRTQAAKIRSQTNRDRSRSRCGRYGTACRIQFSRV